MLAAAGAPNAVAPREGPGVASIVDFLTDGSLVALCEELSTVLGVRIRLVDAKARPVVRSGGSDRTWMIEPTPITDAPVPAPAPGHVAGVVDLDGRQAVAMAVDGAVIGALVIDPDPGAEIDATREWHVRRIAELLATVAADFCRQELDLRYRVREIAAVHRLSSMLTRATSMDAILQTCLESSIQALELDAGSIVLFDNETGPSTQTEVDLQLKASRNLSQAWLGNPLPLSKDRVFDRLALQGEVVTSPDLWADDRVLLEREVRQEGLRAAIHAGLVFQGRAIGVIRLYDRQVRQFDESEKRLIRSMAQQAAVAVEQARLLKIQEREQRIERQLQLAADVQRRMLPRSIPQLPRLELAARYVPSLELGGDFYDFIDLPEGNLGIAIGDVVGKGVAAALLMASVRASLRAHVQDVYHIDDVLQRVNQALCRDTRDNEFATIWYGVVDRNHLRVTYAAAGHDPPLVFHAPPNRAPTSADVDELSIGGMAVGIDPLQRYQRGTYDLRPGDLVVAYTDGLTDVLNFNGKRFGKARLQQAILTLLAQEPDAPAARVIEHVFWELRQFSGILERPDDQTIIVMRVKP